MRRRHSAILLFVLLAFTSSASAGSSSAPGQNAPLNESLPSISGEPIVGKMLMAGTGKWNGPSATHTFQWFRCSSSGNACAPIAGATAQSDMLVSGDAGFTLRVAITASNKNGTSIATSNPTNVVVSSSIPPPSTTSTTTTTSSTTTTTTATITTTPTTTTTGTPTGVNLSAFGAVGDGTHNDTAALQAAFSSGQAVYSSAGKTYLASAQLKLGTSANFQGSTIRFAAGTNLGIYAVNGSAAISNVTVRNAGRAFMAYGAGVKLTAANATALNVAGDMGFGVGDGAALLCSNCHVEGSGQWGFYVNATASALTSISGSTTRTRQGLEIHGANGGSVPNFTSTDDANFGVLLHGARGWHFGQINTSNEGYTSRNQAATGVELWTDAHNNVFDSIVSNKNPGYALAIAGGSTNNTFSSLSADRGDAWDSDPCIVLTSGASSNEITNAVCQNHSVGITFGEDNLTPNNNNHVGSLYVENSPWGGIHFQYGTGNVIGSAKLVNNNGYITWGPADIDFANPTGTPVSGNKVLAVNQSGTTQHPPYALHFAAYASNNSVSGTLTSWQTARVLNKGSSNTYP